MGKEKHEERQGDRTNPPSMFELHHQASDSNVNLVAEVKSVCQEKGSKGSRPLPDTV